jgi:hypothetical protein
VEIFHVPEETQPMTEATIPASRATVSPVREVLNQPPPLEAIDLFAADAALTESVAQFDAGWAEQRLARSECSRPAANRRST